MPKPSPEAPTLPNPRPLLIVITGPSGVGKDAVLSRMKQSRLPFHFVVTLTTRPKRPTEKDGADYRFVSEAEFMALRERNQLLECANVYGNWYGVPRLDIEEAMKAGWDTIVKVDVQGVENIKTALPQAVSVFIAPPTIDDLLARLDKRKTESPDEKSTRLKAARGEMEKMRLFDYIVVNAWGQIDRAVADISRIVSVEKCVPETTQQKTG
jgi:guanylate kinase